MTPEIVVLALFLLFWALMMKIGKSPRLKDRMEVRPFLLLYRTKRFNDFLVRLAEKYGRVWILLGNAGIAISLVAMAYGLYFFSNNIYGLIYIEQVVGPVSPVIPLIPIITISPEILPYFIIAISIIIILHESSHAMTLGADKLKIKSTGLLLFLVIFGAFVEQDDENFKKAKTSSRLRVAAAGSASNIVLALLLLPLLANFATLSSPLYNQGTPITNVTSNSPANLYGLKAGDVVFSVNGTTTPTYYDFSATLDRAKPHDRLLLEVYRNGKPIEISLVSTYDPTNTSKVLIGVEITRITQYVAKYAFLPDDAPWHVYITLYMTQLISLSVGVVNLLPLAPFDGDLLVTALVDRFNKGKTKYVRTALSSFSLGLIALNIGLSLFRFGLVQL